MDFKSEDWYQQLKVLCKTRAIGAAIIFFFFEQQLGREPEKAEFDQLWQGAAKYYYETRSNWRKKNGGI